MIPPRYKRRCGHKTPTYASLLCPTARVTEECYRQEHGATRYNLARHPAAGPGALEVHRSPGSWWSTGLAHPETRLNKRMQSHHSNRLRLTKPTVLGMFRAPILLLWEITSQEPAFLWSNKIFNMGSQVIIRTLLGKPEQGRCSHFTSVFRATRLFEFHWPSRSATKLCSGNKV